MTYVVRTWNCLNRQCGAVFDHGDANPACPKCGCVRVEWRPNGGHIGGVAKAADAELRALADIFRMTDVNSAERGRAAKKVFLPQTPSASVMRFGNFAAAIDPTRARTNENQSGAQCVPTVNRVDYKVRNEVGRKLSGQMGFSSIASNTQVEAAHRPKS